jgi:CPA2 family monovalent cation:H+ antiporter-2
MVSLFSRDHQSLLYLIVQAFTSGAAAIIIIYLFSKYVLEFYFHIVNETRSQEIFIESIFVIVLGSAALSYSLGFSYTLGAFFAGMMISETRYKMQVEVNFVPFRDLMLGIFFISVGLQVRFDFLVEHYITIVLLMTAVMLLKTTLLFGILRFFSSSYVSMKTALSLSQVGEFSFAILGFSLVDGLITPVLSQTLIIAIVFSMVLTPFMLRHINRLATWFEPKQSDEMLSEPIERMDQHIVVIGYGKLGQHIVSHLEAEGLPYVAVDFHANLVREGEKRGHNVKFGDANSPSALEHLHIQNAAAVLIAIYDENRIRYLIDLLGEHHNHLTIIARISDFSQESLLEHLSSHSSVNENDVVARAMVEKVLQKLREKSPPAV